MEIVQVRDLTRRGVPALWGRVDWNRVQAPGPGSALQKLSGQWIKAGDLWGKKKWGETSTE